MSETVYETRVKKLRESLFLIPGVFLVMAALVFPRVYFVFDGLAGYFWAVSIIVGLYATFAGLSALLPPPEERERESS